jgi:hypothetical protein
VEVDGSNNIPLLRLWQDQQIIQWFTLKSQIGRSLRFDLIFVCVLWLLFWLVRFLIVILILIVDLGLLLCACAFVVGGTPPRI